jgi:hypothetical protein
MVSLARAMVLDTKLPRSWLSEGNGDPEFPRFATSIPGGVTAWYTMRLTAIGEDRADTFDMELESALRTYNERDDRRCTQWRARFGPADPAT